MGGDAARAPEMDLDARTGTEEVQRFLLMGRDLASFGRCGRFRGEPPSVSYLGIAHLRLGYPGPPASARPRRDRDRASDRSWRRAPCGVDRHWTQQQGVRHRHGRAGPAGVRLIRVDHHLLGSCRPAPRMSTASYGDVRLRQDAKRMPIVVPEPRFELERPCGPRSLSPLRLPVPPLRPGRHRSRSLARRLSR